jgi:hypothetical protein
MASKNIKVKTNAKIRKKENFADASTIGYGDIISMMSVSPSALDKQKVSFQDNIQDYFMLLLKYMLLVAILTLNFLGLSVSLNCNADQEMFTRIMSAVFAFFFGFVYLIINYYTYKVLTQGKICKMNREKLFPFKM